MIATGLDFARAIQERRPDMPRPPWGEHMRVHEENIIDIVEFGRVLSRWTPGKHFTVPDGYVQGGLIASVADAGQGLAIMTTHDTPEAWVTIDVHIRFVRPIKLGETVTIESLVLTKTKNTAIIETTVSLPNDRMVARITGGWRRSETRGLGNAEV
jgi:uncharacterized protein (TIGR00369 family)